MPNDFKQVPAVYKCFAMIDLLANVRKPLGIADIATALGYHRSTVFNLAYSLTDLGILEQREDGRFSFGTRLYAFSKVAGENSDLIKIVRPYLEEINAHTGLTAFMGIRSALHAVVMDRVDLAHGLKISSEIGMSHSLLAGAGGKALLSQLSDDKIDRILAENDLPVYTRFSCVDKKAYKEMIRKVQEEGIAFDMEEYVEGIRALAVPLRVNQSVPFALWAVGLKKMLSDKKISAYSKFLKQIAKKIENRVGA
jgi:DNA-binding IclR family transcriptional regulator